MKKTDIKKLALAALFVAVMAACSWVSIPTPFGINMTLSVFGVCLTALVLETKYAFCATVVYILLGTIGLPVFSSFSGGAGVLFGISGGFLWGFLIISILCGLSKNANKQIKIFLLTVSVLACHTVGVIQFCFVSGNSLLTGLITASLPFLAKDLILAFFANFVAKKLRLNTKF